MALRFIDGFDHYTVPLDKWDTESGAKPAQISTTVGRFVNGSLLVGGNSHSGFLTKDISTQDEYIAGFAMLFPTDCLMDVIFSTAGGSKVAEITINPPDIELKNAAGTMVATAVSSITAATWQFIEFRVKQHPTLGEIECKVNNVAVASAINQNMGSTAISQIRMESHATSGVVNIDDLYVLDTTGSAPQNTFIGDSRVTALVPKANGTNNQFTPTEATNFESVDEALQDGDASFVEAGQIGAQEDYNQKDFTDLGLSPGTIFSTQVVNCAKKTDAGALKYKDQMVIGGTAFLGAEVTANSSLYKMSTFINDVDPSDSAAWTEAKIAAAGSGFTITFREI
jgi:hypothetical protein